MTYRVTNNDPSETFIGRLVAESLDVARLPGMSGPMPPGTGVFSISDPVEGDNFPLAFSEQLYDGCVLLPEDPSNPAIPRRQRTLTLGPGQSIDVEIFTRSWGMCADGSCSRNLVRAEGEFTDLTSGLACAGFIAAADTDETPDYGWPDAGEVAEASSPLPGVIALSGEPRPAEGRLVTLLWLLIGLLVDDIPDPTSPLIFSDVVMPELGRVQVQWAPDQPYRVDSSFEIEYELDLAALPPFDADFESIEVLDGVPTGFSDLSPSSWSLVQIRDEFGKTDSYFDFTQQIRGVGIDNLGERRPIRWQDVQVDLLSGFDRARVRLGGGQVEPGGGSALDALEIAFDFRGFFSPEPIGSPSQIFEDGFESGNVSRWSLSTP